MKGVPSFCVNGIKFYEHLREIQTGLDIDLKKDLCGKRDNKKGKKKNKDGKNEEGENENGEMDIFHISCNGDIVNIMFGECKVTMNFLAVRYSLQ